ncbi:MAG: M23 family peptidase [Meiothermus sp.]
MRFLTFSFFLSFFSLSLAQIGGNSAQPQVRETRVLGNRYVFVQNPLFAPVTFEFEVRGTNLSLSGRTKFVQVFPPRSLTLAFWGKPAQPAVPWSLSYSWHYIMGDINAVPDGAVYDLPFAPGQSFRINQGYDGAFSHQKELEYSLDFALPEGTPIYAAREGVVVAVQSEYSVGRVDPALKSCANYITVLHPDGTFAHYAHLHFGGSLVKVGDQVRRGQTIGFSGNTGYTSGPHLHFHVYQATSATGGWKTVPTLFETSAGAGMLVEGLTYARPGGEIQQANRPLPSLTPVSLRPASAPVGGSSSADTGKAR